MNKKLLLIASTVGIFSTFVVFAASTNNITFPISELGNCQNKDACRQYCNDPDNIPACQKFAEDHDLTPKTENKDQSVNKLSDAIKNGGPGGCNDIESCRTYCENLTHKDECLAFAKSHGFTPPNKPVTEKDNKINQIIKSGKKLPGNCTDPENCYKYCSDPANKDECIAFAKDNGLIPPQEIEKVNKFNILVKNGETPGGCQTKEECQKYCSEKDNIDECSAFAEKMGFNRDQVQTFKETAGQGPGGCKSKEECETFCNDQANQEICFKFAQEHKIINPDRIEQIKNSADQVRNKLNSLPTEVLNCLNENLGVNIVEKLKNGELLPGNDITAKARVCFARLNDKGNPQPGQSVPPQPIPPRQIPPQLLSCLKEHLNSADYSNFISDHPSTQNLKPEVLQVIKLCSQNLQVPPKPPYPSQSPTTSISACPAGSFWDGRTCVSMAEKCASYGGKWDDSTHTCIRPTPPPPTFSPSPSELPSTNNFGPESMINQKNLLGLILRYLLAK